MAAELQRFTRTERWLHWVHAGAFAVMFATGAVLYAPPLSRVFADRPLIKGIHLFFAVAWVTALVVIAIVGDRRALGRTRAELERFDKEDLLFLRRRPSRPARFNGGQKAHAVVQSALLVLFYVSGALLLAGEANHALRLPGVAAAARLRHADRHGAGARARQQDACHPGLDGVRSGAERSARSSPPATTRAGRRRPRRCSGPARVSIAALLAAGAVSAVGLAAALVLI